VQQAYRISIASNYYQKGKGTLEQERDFPLDEEKGDSQDS